MGALLDIALQSEKSERSEISPPSAPVGDLNSLNSLNSHCDGENLPANDPGPVAPRWRLVHPDGQVFELSIYPPCALTEVQANNPGAKVEPITPPTGGTLPPADLAVITAVCSAWGATPDEARNTIAEAAANPALLANWRREAEGMGLSVDTITVNGRFPTPALAAPPLDESRSVDSDRITCQQCRRLKPGNLCGSPAWGPRYHPPPRPHRCAEFLPRAGDPDQRTGRARWPQLRESRP